MEFVHKAEKALEEPLGTLPALPKETKKGLASIWPWLALIAGVAQLAFALSLYRAARWVDEWADAANQFSRSLGMGQVTDGGLTLWVWLGLIFLIVSAVVLLAAFPKLQKKQKAGWDLLLLGALLNLGYGVVSLFIEGRGLTSLIMSLVGTAISIYLLFQVREFYGGKQLASSTKNADKK